jgi:very-short-patch-repair endonuclease
MPSKPPLTRDVARRLRTRSDGSRRYVVVALTRQPTRGIQVPQAVSHRTIFRGLRCLDASLVIELDGSQHADQSVLDERRTEFLGEAGYAVLRFWNYEIMSDIDEVLQRIADVLGGSLKARKRDCKVRRVRQSRRTDVPHPNPLPLTGEGIGLIGTRTAWRIF